MSQPYFDCPNPLVEFLPDGVRCLLRSEIRFRDSTGRWWIAEPRERVEDAFDGASIPRPLHSILGGPYNGFHRDAALLHDDAYCEAPAVESGFWQADGSRERRAADVMLYEATIVRVRQANLPWHRRSREYVKARVVYDGVRLGGAFAWRNHARVNAQTSA